MASWTRSESKLFGLAKLSGKRSLLRDAYAWVYAYTRVYMHTYTRTYVTSTLYCIWLCTYWCWPIRLLRLGSYLFSLLRCPVQFVTCVSPIEGLYPAVGVLRKHAQVHGRTRTHGCMQVVNAAHSILPGGKLFVNKILFYRGFTWLLDRNSLDPYLSETFCESASLPEFWNPVQCSAKSESYGVYSERESSSFVHGNGEKKLWIQWILSQRFPLGQCVEINWQI